MRIIIRLIIIVVITSFISATTNLDNLCNDSKNITRRIISQRKNIGKIKKECTKLNSLKLKLRKIKGINKLRSNKTLPLKTLNNIENLIRVENIKVRKVTSSYRFIKKDAGNFRKNINVLVKEIAMLTEKWKKQKLLKYKENCLLLIYAQLKKLKKEVNEIMLTPFSYGNPNPIALNQIISGKAGDLSRKTDGSDYKSDEAKLRTKRLELMESIADSDIDEAKDNYEEAKEQFKLAMRILTEHMERMTQVTQKITS